MLDTTMRRMTAAKYSDPIIPTLSPFWDTMSATSPLVIIPTPILRESAHEYLQSFPASPHPITPI